jgi:hypothetical protein
MAGVAHRRHHGIGFDNGGDLFQGLFAEFLANLGQCLALGIRKLYTPFDLVAPDTIFGREILVA